MRSSINDVTVIGGEGQGFCVDITKTLKIKSVIMEEGGQKLRAVVYGRPLTGVLSNIINQLSIAVKLKHRAKLGYNERAHLTIYICSLYQLFVITLNLFVLMSIPLEHIQIQHTILFLCDIRKFVKFQSIFGLNTIILHYIITLYCISISRYFSFNKSLSTLQFGLRDQSYVTVLFDFRHFSLGNMLTLWQYLKI